MPTARTPRTRQPSPAAQVPPTVLTGARRPHDPTRAWSPELLDQLVRSLTNPGEHVALLDTAPPERDHTPALAEAHHQLHQLGRPARTVHAPLVPDAPGPRPFWQGLVTDQPHHAGALAPASEDGNSPEGTDDGRGAAWADLVLTHLSPDVPIGAGFGLTPARLLRPGGNLAVLTHTGHHADGQLIDPTGPVVAACQNADLLYLQHLIALHTPVDDTGPRPLPAHLAADDTGGEPWRHQRVHTDVLLFALPHDDSC